MSNWADDMIAGPLGYVYCVLFPRAREAIKAWTWATGKVLQLPTNVCAVAKDWAKSSVLYSIDDSGMAPGITTQLYGYREEGDGKSALDLDPLGTGFFARPCAKSSIVSFGEKKFIMVGGAAFSTNDQGLAEEMEARSRGFPPAYEAALKIILDPHRGALAILADTRRTKQYLWDRHLGDHLQRIPREQVIPWRVMRKAKNVEDRDLIVRSLRLNGYDVGTNYPALDQKNDFEDRVLNFFLADDYDEDRIKRACDIIKRAIYDHS